MGTAKSAAPQVCGVCGGPLTVLQLRRPSFVRLPPPRICDACGDRESAQYDAEAAQARAEVRLGRSGLRRSEYGLRIDLDAVLVKAPTEDVRSFAGRCRERGAIGAVPGHTALLEACQDWRRVEDGRDWIIATGPVGVGKTLTLKGLLVAQARRGHSVLVLREGDLFTMPLDEQREVLDRACRIYALLLDDVGAWRSRSDWQRNLIERILMHRYDADRPTFLTSNLTMRELHDVVEPRCFDRLCEKARHYSYDKGAPNWRRM